MQYTCSLHLCSIELCCCHTYHIKEPHWVTSSFITITMNKTWFIFVCILSHLEFYLLVVISVCKDSCIMHTNISYSCRTALQLWEVHLQLAVRSSAALRPAPCAAGSWAAPAAGASAAGRGAGAGLRAAASCPYRKPLTTPSLHAPAHHLLQSNGQGHREQRTKDLNLSCLWSIFCNPSW